MYEDKEIKEGSDQWYYSKIIEDAQKNPNNRSFTISHVPKANNQRKRVEKLLLENYGGNESDKKLTEVINKFSNAIIGGVPGLVAVYGTDAIGSLYNGYSPLDPKNPGLVTERFSRNHPYISLGINFAVGSILGGLTAKEPNLKSKDSFSNIKNRFDQNRLQHRVALEALNPKNGILNIPQNKYLNRSYLNYITENSRLAFRERLKEFASKYNYPVFNLDSSIEDLQAQAKHLLRKHNTYFRGVTDINSSDKQFLPNLGKGMSKENMLRYAATHPKIEGDFIWVSPFSNASGYGKVARIRRNFKLSNNPNNWFQDADFNVNYGRRYSSKWGNGLIDTKDWDLYQKETLVKNGVVSPWITESNVKVSTKSPQNELGIFDKVHFVDWAPKHIVQSSTLNTPRVSRNFYRKSGGKLEKL